jgi:hypothetical protein
MASVDKEEDYSDASISEDEDGLQTWRYYYSLPTYTPPTASLPPTIVKEEEVTEETVTSEQPAHTTPLPPAIVKEEDKSEMEQQPSPTLTDEEPFSPTNVKKVEGTEETVTPEQRPPIAPALPPIDVKEEDGTVTREQQPQTTIKKIIREWDGMLQEYPPQSPLKTFEFIREWSELLKDLSAAPLPTTLLTTIPLPAPVVAEENVTETAPLTTYIGFAYLDSDDEIEYALHARVDCIGECERVEFCLGLHPYRHRIGRALRDSGALILGLQVKYDCVSIVIGGKLRDKEIWKRVSIP